MTILDKSHLKRAIRRRYSLAFLMALSAILCLAVISVQARDLSSRNPKISKSDNAATKDADSFQFPVGNPSDHSGWRVVLCFGCSWTTGSGHLAEDYENQNGPSDGQPVYVAANGVVKYATGADATDGYGGIVIIEHHLPDGEIFTSVYGHLAHPAIVKAGQAVSRGQLIGQTADQANDGGSWKPHLHFGIRNGPYDPNFYTCSNGYGNWVYLGYEQTCDSHFTLSNWQRPSDFIPAHFSSSPPSPSQPTQTPSRPPIQVRNSVFLPFLDSIQKSQSPYP